MHRTRLHRRAALLLCAILLPATAHAQFRLESRKPIAITAAAPDQVTGPVMESYFIDTVGSSPFDRIGLHRLALGSAKADPGRPVLLFLPGTNMNGEVPIGDPNHWLPLFLAVHGIEVWSLDYRSHFVPPDTPPANLVILGEWHLGVFAADVGRAAAFIMHETGRRRLFVAGFSRGAEFAYLFAAAHPKEVQGLIILDGYLFRHLPGSGAAVHGPQRYVDDISGGKLTYDKRKALLEAVIHDPNGPAPLPQFRSAADNLNHVVYGAAAFGGHGGLANPYGGFSDPRVLARVLITYDRYWPAVQDNEDPLTPQLGNRLAASKIPVVAFSSTNIAPQWPVQVRQSAAITNGASAVTVLRGWGHLDVLCGSQSRQRVYEPVLAFIKLHAGSAGIGQDPSRPRSWNGRPAAPG